MKRSYLSTLISLLLVTIFTQVRFVKGQIYEEFLPRAGQMYY